MTRVITVRVPACWAQLVTSQRARYWIASWLRQPVPLAHRTEAGTSKLSIRLALDEIVALKRLSGQTTSSAVRAIIAQKLSPAAAEKPVNGLKVFLCAVATAAIAVLFAFVGLEPPKGQGS